jgi:hypothetical protein
MTDPLAARFDALVEPAPPPDWLDVRRRARRSRRPLLLAAAALLLLVAVPVAIAVRSGALPWNGADAAPRAVVERFAAHDRAFAEFTRRQTGRPVEFGILASQARSFPLGGGSVAYIAPTRSGGFFAFLENPRDPFGSIDYRFPSDRPAPAVASLLHGRATGGSWVNGHVLGPPASTVEIVLDDGSTLKPPVTWIGPPIDAGLYYAHVAQGRHVVAVVLRDADGKELARDGHLGAAYGAMQKAKAGALPAAPGSGAPEPGTMVVPGG